MSSGAGDGDDLVEVMARLHASLAPGDLLHTLAQVTEAAIDLLPDAHWSSITVDYADGRIETIVEAAGATVAGSLDQAQQDAGEGPTIDAHRDGDADADVEHDLDALRDDPAPLLDEDPVMSGDLAHDTRYRSYAPQAVRAGVHAQAAVPLFETASARGVLNLYSRRSEAFVDTRVLTALFAHHAATALAYAADIDDRASAQGHRRRVGQAVGIVMERYELTEASAFAFLNRVAQHRDVSVQLVAQELIARTERTGES